MLSFIFQKSKNKLKLEQAPTSSQLNLYRFAQQALDIPVEHPVAVLTWQRFFILFLGRLDTSAQLKYVHVLSVLVQEGYNYKPKNKDNINF